MPKQMIGDAWKLYELMGVPSTAGDLQRKEARRAFYAGAQSVFEGIIRSLTPGDEPQDEDLAMMDGIRDELADFVKQIQARKA